MTNLVVRAPKRAYALIRIGKAIFLGLLSISSMSALCTNRDRPEMFQPKHRNQTAEMIAKTIFETSLNGNDPKSLPVFTRYTAPDYPWSLKRSSTPGFSCLSYSINLDGAAIDVEEANSSHAEYFFAAKTALLNSSFSTEHAIRKMGDSSILCYSFEPWEPEAHRNKISMSSEKKSWLILTRRALLSDQFEESKAFFNILKRDQDKKLHALAKTDEVIQTLLMLAKSGSKDAANALIFFADDSVQETLLTDVVNVFIQLNQSLDNRPSLCSSYLAKVQSGAWAGRIDKSSYLTCLDHVVGNHLTLAYMKELIRKSPTLAEMHHVMNRISGEYRGTHFLPYYLNAMTSKLNGNEEKAAEQFRTFKAHCESFSIECGSLIALYESTAESRDWDRFLAALTTTE